MTFVLSVGHLAGPSASFEHAGMLVVTIFDILYAVWARWHVFSF